MATVVIVGGGVAGLTAGIYTLMGGHRAIICERHVKAGGNLTGWQRGEYHIDNCIHWLTGTNTTTKTYAMWKELGALGDVKIYQGDRLFTCELDGEEMSLYYDLELMRARMLEISSEDKREIESFISAVRLMQGFSGISGEKHNGRVSLWDTVRQSPILLKYYRMSTGELASRFHHPLLSRFFSALMGERFGALALITVVSCFCGGNGGIPEGGSVAMAERMANRFLSLGGELLLGNSVTRIDHSGGVARSVTLSDGNNIAADYVVITSDPAVAFPSLLNAPLPRVLQREYNNPKNVRFSSIQCAYACDCEILPFNADYIIEVPFRDRSLLRSRNLVVRGFSHERGFAPEGKNVIQTLTFCTEKDAIGFISLRREDREAYTEKKRCISDVSRRIVEQKFPSLSGKLNCLDVWTPATYRRFTDCEMGSYMSFVFLPERIPSRIKSKVDGFDNVLLATQWQRAPGGLPIAAECGRVAAEYICKREAHAAARIKRTKKAYV